MFFSISLKISPQNKAGELLSDEEFRKKKLKLAEEKENLEERIRDCEKRVNKWVELSEKTFNFACYARHWFQKGDLETRREILRCFSSNLTLKNKKVRCNPQKPLNYIEEAKEKFDEITRKLEPRKKQDISINYEQLFAQNPSLLPLKDLFCNRKIEFGITKDDMRIAFESLGLNQCQPAFATVK